jgi:hypothetical protein
VLGRQAGGGLPFLLIAAVTAAVVLPLAVGSSPRRHPAMSGLPQDGDRLPPAGGGSGVRTILGLARLPGFSAAAGGLMVAGAVSGASQLLIAGGLHADGISPGRIGLAFSAAAIS